MPDLELADDVDPWLYDYPLRLAQRGRSLIHVMTASPAGRVPQVESWQHYPRADCVTVCGAWQVYFHAHPSEAAAHGAAAQQAHLHLFRRYGAGRLAHVAALNLDARGLPQTWSTLFPWVTGGDFWSYRQTGVLASAPWRAAGPWAGVIRWIGALVRLNAPVLLGMLARRELGMQQLIDGEASTVLNSSALSPQQRAARRQRWDRCARQRALTVIEQQSVHGWPTQIHETRS